ncbi:hypothetical protein IscW_ISCW005089 [Ixodes scapularis]|uniref:Uncharacterized protein n=1 Tax=Ixodes scapularis TaxID=6945 RepID=B7PH25_IXOSC|nr:hypothetical protein IscW_ISCW005089 [Ixodes scapularis]|eukprot:XP_002401987.1 hypothetical protein IscW_ISCW005089 [Ixodes scapularis]
MPAPSPSLLWGRPGDTATGVMRQIRPTPPERAEGRPPLRRHLPTGKASLLRVVTFIMLPKAVTTMLSVVSDG